ncbi:hypothetical protein PR003_g1202 [Phytophthora rubi]|uniref:Ankyrin repeat-containing domain n=1 Tax=Phytophthora rubi TaxID=129364 RepID=A0A6A4G8K7_9STRA|nr:hypothetical protein PR003_g1202 [Phytophthora rubi]
MVTPVAPLTVRLTSAIVVLRTNPFLGALPHVISCVSQCLDHSVAIPLSHACAFGSLRLLRRVWDVSEEFAASDGETRRCCWSPLQFLQSDRHYYRAQFSQAVVEAVRRGDLNMIRWLFDHFAGCVVTVQAVEAAAASGDLQILKFFLHTEVATQDAAEANSVHWGGGDLAAAVENEHTDVARWIFECKGSVERDWGRFMAAVVRKGDLELLQWLLDRGYAGRQLAPPRMDDAAWGGHLNTVICFLSEQGANMTATEPALICHTYMSCIAQIVAAGKQLAGVNRFCSAICPQEILGTVT